MNVSASRKLRGFLQRNAPLMIACRGFDEFICDYLDGTLSWRQRIVFEAHLLYCRECRDYLAAYKQTIALGRAVCQHSNEPVPAGIPEDLVRAILAARRAADGRNAR